MLEIETTWQIEVRAIEIAYEPRVTAEVRTPGKTDTLLVSGTGRSGQLTTVSQLLLLLRGTTTKAT